MFGRPVSGKGIAWFLPLKWAAGFHSSKNWRSSGWKTMKLGRLSWATVVGTASMERKREVLNIMVICSESGPDFVSTFRSFQGVGSIGSHSYYYHS